MRVFDFVVVGGGIAGLSAVIRLAAGTGPGARILCVTKEALAESNTSYAQGGIAVAMGGEEDVTLHLSDTLTAGDGLVNEDAAAKLVGQGPVRVEELLQWGTQFDRGSGGELERTREGAHSLSRILHAHGDATGKEIARALLAYVQGLGKVELMEWTTTIDLEVDRATNLETDQASDLQVAKGRVVGASLLSRDGKVSHVRAGAVLIASGGAGQVFSDTTNPAVATGDGIAMAYRAGAAVEDMEFYQFHPTAFSLPGAPRFLLSEALRGEGALLLNVRQERFMPAVHPLAELAPRDVVARAITREGLSGPVYLDMRHVTEIDLTTRFPGISKFLASYGLDLAKDLIPVRPAAHYLMGGIKTDVQGRTTLPGLYAAGEAACTGVHGANRLASNSLLEGLVFGVEAAQTMMAEAQPLPATQAHETDEAVAPETDPDPDQTAKWITNLRDLMWRDAGLLRDATGLKNAQLELGRLLPVMPMAMTRQAIEARNLYTVASMMVECALGRQESRGAHFRNDFPKHDAVARHSVLEQGRLRFEVERAASAPAQATLAGRL